MQQQLGPIWDAVDDEQFQYALQLIEKLQKRYRVPDPTLLGLQGLCLCRIGRHKEAVSICERLREERPDKRETYQTIHDILKATTDPETSAYLVSTMKTGFRLIKSEFMGRMWFIEAVRAGDLVAQRRAAVELQKGFLSRDYFYLVLMSMLLLYQRKADATEEYLLGLLMYRMVTKAEENIPVENPVPEGPRIDTKEEYYVYLDILKALGKYEHMLDSLEGYHGQRFDNHDFLLLKLELCQSMKQMNKAQSIAAAAMEAGVDDWLVLKSYIDAAHAQGISREEVTSKIVKDDQVSRNSLLARVYAESLHYPDRQDQGLIAALVQYLQEFPDKLASFEDLAPYFAVLEESDRKIFLQEISSLSGKTASGEVILSVNLLKFRLLFDKDSRDDTALVSCLNNYSAALALGKELAEQDNQYGDDFLTLCVQSLLKSQSYDRQSLLMSAILLEHGLTHAKHNFQFRLILISIYRKLGAWSLANVHYQALSIKHIQRDTLSYILLEDSAYEYVSTMQLTVLKESQHIYERNLFETPDMICQAYENKTYSKVAEFINFRERLDNSIWWHESRVNSWTLQLLLDKFDFSQSVTSIPETNVYDNKSRHVILDIHHIRDDKSTSHLADSKDIVKLNRAILRIQIIQAVVTSRKLLDGMDSRLDSADDVTDRVVGMLYTAKFTPSEIQLSNALLLNTIQQVQLPNDLVANSFDQETLRTLGDLVQTIKYYSIMAPHIKLLSSSCKAAMQTLHNKLKTAIEHLRQSIISTANEVSLPTDTQLDISSSFTKQITDKIKTSQRESVTCLLGVLKTIKL